MERRPQPHGQATHTMDAIGTSSVRRQVMIAKLPVWLDVIRPPTHPEEFGWDRASIQ